MLKDISHHKNSVAFSTCYMWPHKNLNLFCLETIWKRYFIHHNNQWQTDPSSLVTRPNSNVQDNNARSSTINYQVLKHLTEYTHKNSILLKCHLIINIECQAKKHTSPDEVNRMLSLIESNITSSRVCNDGVYDLSMIRSSSDCICTNTCSLSSPKYHCTC